MAKILVIDDAAGFQRTVWLILTRAGHSVVCADDGVEGLKMFVEEQPDLVISDMVMPNRQGGDTIREIRMISAGVPIVAMTGGYSDLEDELSADAVLEKPFRAAELVDLVSRLLQSKFDSTARWA